MITASFLKQFSRLALTPAPFLKATTKQFSILPALQFKITDQLWAEPMKKKKKMDPAIVRAREERRRKKLEKNIRRLQKNARQLKPIDEMEIPLDLVDQLSKRKRTNKQLTEQVIEERALLQKDWSRYKRQEYIANVAQIDRIMVAQRRALEKLYEESEELYNEAIMPDLQLIPYSVNGTLATPPIKGYVSPDGEYIDVTRKWNN